MGIFDKLVEKVVGGEEGESFKERLSNALDGCKEKIKILKPC